MENKIVSVVGLTTVVQDSKGIVVSVKNPQVKK